jgi:hypothetical protein
MTAAKKATKVPKGTKRTKKIEIVEQAFDSGTADAVETIAAEDSVIVPAVDYETGLHHAIAVPAEEAPRPLTWQEKLKKLFFAW